MLDLIVTVVLLINNPLFESIKDAVVIEIQKIDEYGYVVPKPK